jgi:hypothetical protein
MNYSGLSPGRITIWYTFDSYEWTSDPVTRTDASPTRTPLGVCRNALEPTLTPSQAIRATGELGLDALLFHSIFDLDRHLDNGRIADFKAEASAEGVELSAGLPALHPDRFAADPDLATAGAGDSFVGFVRALVSSA